MKAKRHAKYQVPNLLSILLSELLEVASENTHAESNLTNFKEHQRKSTLDKVH